MLALPYVPDSSALGTLKSREAELGVRLPPSFTEWFGMRNGVDLLRSHSNSDDPIAIEELGSPLCWRWTETRDCLREGLLPFMVENQGVCVWAISLDGSDDPAVIVARDPELDWRACARSFSDFIDCQIWDHTVVLRPTLSEGVLLTAQDHPLRAEDLAFLRHGFSERTSTAGWPGEHQYRFESREGCLLLWDNRDQADWFIASENDEDLFQLTKGLWHVGNLRSSLWSNDDRGTDILERLRA
jgi:hypothetical protein